MNINKKLQNIYMQQIEGLFEELAIRSLPSSSPFLLKIDEDKWLSADYKVVIFG